MKTKEEARQFAINLKESINKKSLYWSEVLEIDTQIYKIGKRFGLIKEFRENGLI